MSTTNFVQGQRVLISAPHGHFNASNDTIYHVGSINRVQGLISVQLLHNNKSVGAIPESKLSPAK